MSWQFGIEHEIAFLRNNQFADFTNSKFEEFQAIVNDLPRYQSDYPALRIGDLGIKDERWYIEGFERFSPQGKFLRCDPKGIEIRTIPHATIDAAVGELKQDYVLLGERADAAGLKSVAVAYNPFAAEYMPTPPLNNWEQIHRSEPEDQTAYMHMVTYGPDLDFSCSDFSVEQTIDIARKLTYYSPYIVPFSFSAPFSDGKLWRGLSKRAYYRTGKRPAALVFVEQAKYHQPSQPSLTQIARYPGEIGRIEFKAFDSCSDFSLYGSLLALLKGLALDNTLSGRASVPDAKLHQRSALAGFDNDEIAKSAQAVLAAARGALSANKDADGDLLARLEVQLDSRTSQAKKMIEEYNKRKDILSVLEEVC